MRVLGPGFWGTRRLATLANEYSTPATERLIVHVCIKYKIRPQNYFSIEEL